MLDDKTHISELVLAEERGEDVVTARAGVPAAHLVAVGPGVEPVELGLLAGQIALGEDFDAPLEDFGPRAIGLLHGRGGFRTCDLSRVKRGGLRAEVYVMARNDRIH